MEVLGEGEVDKTMRVHVMRGKTEIFFKTYLGFNLICAKHTIFTTRLTHEQVAKMSGQNPLNKILKIFLSVFHDWEVHSRVSCEMCCESFYVSSRLELPLTKSC